MFLARGHTPMGMSHDVRLPKSATPVYPRRCVACGEADPAARVRVGTHTIGWYTFVFLHTGSRFTADVPACDECARDLRRWRRIKFTLDCVLYAMAAGAAIYLFGWYDGPFRKWLLTAVAVACLLPLILLEVFHPPAADLTAYADTVDYEFADRGYAEEFAALNGARVD